jgi:hypothetical protein
MYRLTPFTIKTIEVISEKCGDDKKNISDLCLGL